MISFSDATAAPIKVTVQGVDYKVRPFGFDEYEAWCAEITPAKREEALKALSPKLTFEDRQRQVQAINEWEATPHTLEKYILRPLWMKRIFAEALTRAGVPSEQQEDFRRSLPVIAQQEFVSRVSGLFTEETLNQWYGNGKAPEQPKNDEAASNSPTTGSPTGSSSGT